MNDLLNQCVILPFPGVAKGGLKNLTVADQKRLKAVLGPIVGSKAAGGVVNLAATLVNGLLGKVPLHSLLHPVVDILKGLLGQNGALGGLLGRGTLLGDVLDGVGGLLNSLLGGRR